MKNKIVLFVNDSYFSYLLAKDLIISNADNISLIIFSKNTTNSFSKVFKIFNKASKRYFFYRLAIQILSKTLYRKKSVMYLANKLKIKKCFVETKNDLDYVLKNNGGLGFAFNFDMVLKSNMLSKFQKGVYNIHASKLPKDKGVSPLLWAFVRGDKHVWSTIYKMDDGLDTGPILKQFQISVNTNDTAFSLYRRVCVESGIHLNNLFDEINRSQVKLSNQTDEIESNYFSWPDKQFELMMSKSNKKFINIKDLI